MLFGVAIPGNIKCYWSSQATQNC